MAVCKIRHIFVVQWLNIIKIWKMIVSNLKNSSRIESLHPLFRTLFEYVKSHDLLHADLGRIDIAGDDLYINNVAADGVSADKQPLEVHRAYIDVHILLEGAERIGWKPLEDVTEEIKSYSEEGDCALYSDRATTYIDLRPGEYVIVYPEDTHAPLIGQGKIRKLIAKVKL